ncbi:hypothetical protein OSB04_004021 [Centaurea solstitialis]|uniref:Reverse transcriptase zinc-binding domain-containing protein n=1 Tax=Centaurea solstitialis TaxID=347529 RepID=A0AA38WU31_9ASTR|nr:hypothetical protein OSB04_004021 [Centaurea solstitialis]
MEGIELKRGTTLKAARGGMSVPTWWMKELPKKICIFMWRVRLGRIPVRLSLDSRGIDLDSVLCPRCEGEGESVDHALVDCVEAKRLWNLIGNWWKVDVKECSSVAELCNLCNKEGVGVKGGKRWVAMVWCVCYLIWVNRNNLVFSKKKVVLSENLFHFQLMTFEWINLRSKEIAVDWQTWMIEFRLEVGRRQNLVFSAIGAAYFWCVWESRNRAALNKGHKKEIEIFRDIQFIAFDWLRCQVKGGRALSWVNWTCNPANAIFSCTASDIKGVITSIMEETTSPNKPPWSPSPPCHRSLLRSTTVAPHQTPTTPPSPNPQTPYTHPEPYSKPQSQCSNFC